MTIVFQGVLFQSTAIYQTKCSVKFIWFQVIVYCTNRIQTIWIQHQLLVEQELPTLPEHMSSLQVCSEVCVAQSCVLQIVVSSFVLLLLTILLSVVLRFTASDYHFGNFKLFFVLLVPCIYLGIVSKKYILTNKRVKVRLACDITFLKIPNILQIIPSVSWIKCNLDNTPMYIFFYQNKGIREDIRKIIIETEWFVKNAWP